MKSNYMGFLVKSMDGAILDRYIQQDSYSTVPDQRLDKNSYRDGYGELHRTVLTYVSTTLTFSTISGLTLAEKEKLQLHILSGLESEIERKVRLLYWNDERNEYVTDTLYMPDVTYKVKRRTRKTIYYDSVEYKFIGYGQERT